MKSKVCSLGWNFKRARSLLLIVILMSLPLSKAMSLEGSFVPLMGTWQVQGVRLDETLSRKPNYNYDDPRLVGRLFTISSGEIRTDLPEDTLCTEPKAKAESTTADGLVGNTMGRSKKKGERPHAKNFALPVDGAKELQVWWIGCMKGDLGPDTPFGPEGLNWVARLSKGQVALRWYDNTILLLKRLSPDLKPHPAFPCERSSNSTEKAICSSFSLSEYDQSISRTFSSTVRGYRKEGMQRQAKELQVSQKQWIGKRNGCGEDINCIRKSMQERLEELSNMQ